MGSEMCIRDRFCTMHGDGPVDIESRGTENFAGVFERYVFLTDKNMAGEIDGVYDEKMRRLDE